MTTKQKRIHVKSLSKQVKSSIFEMLKLTSEILSDHEYVDEFGGEDALVEALEEDEFSHFGKSPRLQTMLKAYRANPSEKAWKENRYDIRVMIDLSMPGEEEKGKVERINWKALAKKLEADVARLEAALDQSQAEVKELSERCERLLIQNAELKGQFKQLEKSAAAA